MNYPLHVEARRKPWQGSHVVGVASNASGVISNSPTVMNNLKINGDWSVATGHKSQTSGEE
jgi:hypothetical protein